MSVNELESRIEEFFQLQVSTSPNCPFLLILSLHLYYHRQGTGLAAYKLSPKSAADAQDCFMGDLGFGTAGLRSEMDVGFNRMNEVTVRIAAMVKRCRPFLTALSYSLCLGDRQVFEGKV